MRRALRACQPRIALGPGLVGKLLLVALTLAPCLAWSQRDGDAGMPPPDVAVAGGTTDGGATPDPHAAPPAEGPSDRAGCVAIRGRWYEQRGVNGCMQRGHRQGLWRVAAKPEEQIRAAEGWVKDGKLHGPYRELHDNGAVAVVGGYIAGKKTGTWQGWYAGGQPSFAEHFVDDRRDGPSVRWYSNCQRATQGDYVEGQQHGRWTSWYAKGHKSEEGDYDHGKQVGTWTFWHEKGPMIRQGPFVDDREQGTFREWSLNGHLWRSVEFDQGERVGEWEKKCREAEGDWTVDYEVREDGCLVDGKKTGEWRGSYPDGKPQWKAIFVGGVETGHHVDYHPTGEVLREGEYDQGVPTGRHVFRAKDGVTEYGRSEIVEGSGAWKAFWPDGTPREAGELAGGARVGTWTWWFENGNTEHTET